MNKMRKTSGLLSLVVVSLLLAGCLISGTFVVTLFIPSFEASTDNNFYHYEVDLTTESVWQDHKDNIDNIDVIGFELWITNNSGGATTFNAWIDDVGNPVYDNISDVEDNATQVLKNLDIPDGEYHVTYGASLSHVVNVSTLRDLARSGKFHYYGTSSAGGPGADFVIDSARVIVTLTAGA